MENRPKVGVGVLVLKQNLVLLGKRKGAHGEGTWQLPGGHLEFGEEPEECARRETFEETGIRIKSLRRGAFTNDIFVADGKHYVTLFLIAEYDSGEVQVREPEKCERWDWFEWADLPKPLFLPLVNFIKQGSTIHEES